MEKKLCLQFSYKFSVLTINLHKHTLHYRCNLTFSFNAQLKNKNKTSTTFSYCNLRSQIFFNRQQIMKGTLIKSHIPTRKQNSLRK